MILCSTFCRQKMIIKRIKIYNFKSLVNLEMPLAKFNCFVGLNGSGKSTVLQFFDFLSQQLRGDIKGWLSKRKWSASDIKSKLASKKKNIDFEVLLTHSQGFEIKWTASFNTITLRCTFERVDWNNNLILRVENGKYYIWSLDEKERENTPKLSGVIPFDYQGSLISQVKENQLTEEIIEFKKFFEGLHTLDLLSPELLRQRTKESKKDLGLGGEYLSAFLYDLAREERVVILDKLSKIYPNLKQFDITTIHSGWKQLMVEEQFGNIALKTEARHIADGILRMLAVFAQLSKETKDQSFLLLDEIENGINPELIEFLVDSLVEASPQVLVTTHSPMVLNYLEDSTAIDGVIYLYKEQNGATQAIRLFDIPSMRKKLTVMGPGEVYEDTLLTQLGEEIMTLKKQK